MLQHSTTRIVESETPHPFLIFEGTILKKLDPRQNKLHNRILLNNINTCALETVGKILNTANHLYNFFPYSYLNYITKNLIRYKPKMILERKYKGRKKLWNTQDYYSFFLACLTLIYTKEGRHLPDSIIQDINSQTNLNIHKREFHLFFRLILKTLPKFKENYPKNRKNEFLNCIKYCLHLKNKNGESRKEITLIHLETIALTKKFIHTDKFKHIRPYNYELYAKAFIHLIYQNLLSKTHPNPFSIAKSDQSSFQQKKFQIKKGLKEIKSLFTT
ncbi:MAG: hypothetical protein ACXAC8_17585 [Candidatus Hodarchaeales archaeon]|jgi:hypothetical protein